MKKTLITTAVISTVIIIGAIVFAITQSKIPETETVVITPEPEQPIAMCYQYNQETSGGLADRAILKMNITGDGGTNVTGEYRNLPAEKDSKVGTFAGTIGPMDPTISARTADVWWDSMAEGMRITEQLHIIFGEGSATAQFGEMVDRGDGTYMYKDPANLTNGFQMSQVDCAVLDML